MSSFISCYSYVLLLFLYIFLFIILVLLWMIDILITTFSRLQSEFLFKLAISQTDVTFQLDRYSAFK